MRGLLTVVFFIIFILAAPLAVFSYSVNSVINAEYLNSRLTEGRVYEGMAKVAPIFINASQKTTDEESKKALEEFFAEELNVTYLKYKVQPFITDIFAFYSGKTQDPPSINFKDLGEKLTERFDNRLPPETLLVAEITIPKNGNTDQLIKNYKIFQNFPLALGIVSGLSLLSIFLLAMGWQSKLRRLSSALFIISIPVLAASGLTYFALNETIASSLSFYLNQELAQYTTAESFGQLDIFSNLVKGALQPFLLDLIRPMLYLSLAGCVVGLLFLFVSFLLGRRAKKATAAAGQNSPQLAG